MKTSFIGIGAQKCASSWIYDILADHPGVCLSEKKELDFFSYHYEHGYDWYERHFMNRRESQVCGEISPSYFHDPRAPSRTATYNPEFKILVSLRDPVERAISHHKHEVRIGTYIGPDLSFEAGLKQNPAYLQQGLYALHLNKWMSRYSKSQLLIVFMEEIRKDPAVVAKRVYRFLGIDENHSSIALNNISNPGYVVRYRYADQIIKTIRRLVRSGGLGRVWQGLSNSPIREMYRSINRVESNKAIPLPKPETMSFMRKYFQEDILQLQTMTGADLSAWMER